MRWVLLFLFLLTTSFANATLAPRRSSILTQLSGTTLQIIQGTSESYSYNGSFELIYLILRGPSFGLRFFGESRNEVGYTEVGRSFGVSVGYYSTRGPFLMATYNFEAELGHWKNGDGSQIDLGYLEHMGNQFHIGLKYSNRTMQYRSDSTDRTAKERNVNDTFPGLILMYQF